jgi:hypothetical protein
MTVARLPGSGTAQASGSTASALRLDSTEFAEARLEESSPKSACDCAAERRQAVAHGEVVGIQRRAHTPSRGAATDARTSRESGTRALLAQMMLDAPPALRLGDMHAGIRFPALVAVHDPAGHPRRRARWRKHL